MKSILHLRFACLLALPFLFGSCEDTGCQFPAPPGKHNKQVHEHTTISTGERSKTITQQTSTPAGPDSLQINGTLYYRNSYCGGAYPNPEILESYKKTKIFSRGEVYFKLDDKKIKVRADNQGKFSCRLVPGRYKVYLARNRDPKGNVWYYEENDGQWWAQQAFAQFKVDSTKHESLSVIMDFTCAPSDRNRP